jgi:ABC-type lipoprotein release transport system permease subunit
MAKMLNKNIGDYIEIYLEEDKRADQLITGLFQSFLQFGTVCRLTTSAYTENDCEINYNTISVYLNKSKDTENFINDMKVKIGGSGNVIKRTEQYGSIMNMIVAPQQKALPPVAALIMIIAGLNIFSIVYLKNMKSQKINGIYKCIGYTTWHLILSNLWYVAAIATAAVVVTLPLSILTYAPIMKLSLSMLNFMEYPMTINLTHMITVNIAVFLIFIASTLASLKALFTANARDLIQE